MCELQGVGFKAGHLLACDHAQRSDLDSVEYAFQSESCRGGCAAAGRGVRREGKVEVMYSHKEANQTDHAPVPDILAALAVWEIKKIIKHNKREGILTKENAFFLGNSGFFLF